MYDTSLKVTRYGFDVPKTITTEENECYIRVSGKLSHINLAIIQEGDNIDEEKGQYYLQSIAENTKSIAENTKSIAENTKSIAENTKKIDSITTVIEYDNDAFVNIGFIGSNGNVGSNADFNYTDFIEIDPKIVSSIEAYAVFDNNYGGGICFYGDGKDFISSVYDTLEVQYPGLGTYLTREIPYNAKYIRVTGAVASSDCYVKIIQNLIPSSIYESIKQNTQKIEENKEEISKLKSIVLKNAFPTSLYAKKGINTVIYPQNALCVKDDNGLYNFIVSEFDNYNNVSIGNFNEQKATSVNGYYLDNVFTVKEGMTIKPIDLSLLTDKHAKILCVGDSYTDGAVWVNEIYTQFTTDGIDVEMIGTQKDVDRRCEGLSGGLMSWLLNKSGDGFFVHVTNSPVLPVVGYGKPQVTDANEKEWQVRGVKENNTDGFYEGYMRIATWSENYDGDFPTSGILTYQSQQIQYDSAVKCGFNPFWDIETGKNNISKYLSKWSLNEPNIVCIQFGMNDLTWGGTVDAVIKNAQNLISMFHEQLPDAKIIYSVPPYGSYENPKVMTLSSQGNTYRNKINFIDFYNKLNAIYEEQTYIKIVPSFLYVDRVNGYTYKEIVPNERYSDVKIKTPTDNVHCNEKGMRQISDGVVPYIYGLLVE